MKVKEIVAKLLEVDQELEFIVANIESDETPLRILGFGPEGLMEDEYFVIYVEEED